MHVQHGYCRTGARSPPKSPAAAPRPCPRRVLHSPVPARATAGQSVSPEPFPAGPEFSCSLFGYKEQRRAGPGGGGGVPGGEAGGAARPAVPARSAAPGAGPRSVAPPARSSGPGGAERGRTTGGGRRSWSCGWGLSPRQPQALQLPWSCSGCCWLPLCSRSCPVSTPGTDPGGGKAGCRPAGMQRLSSAELAAVLGGM